MKHILIVPEYWLPHIHYMVQAFRQCDDLDVKIYWTNEKWWRRVEHGPKDDTKNVSYLPPETAMPMLERGHFDAVVFSEGTLLAFMCANAPGKTKRIFLDSADHGYIVSQFLDAVDMYLKCQHPPIGQPVMAGDSTDLTILANSGKPVIPWPYCPSSWIDESWLEDDQEKEAVVHFRGASWPAKRVMAIEKLHDAGVPIRGGFFERPHPLMRYAFPAELKADRIDFQEHLKEMRGCLVALNAIGNGEMCFRACEILQAGVCMVTQSINIDFPGRAPRHMEECVICPDDDSMIEVCKWLLDNPDRCKAIGAAGRKYWEAFLGPKAWARRLTSIL